MIKVKELETFLNSVAEFSKTDPKTAVLKAIGQLALVKGAEALYMEEGGLIGETSEKSLIGFNGFSRRHKSGQDVLVHAEKGEGILSRNDISNMGGKDAFLSFKNALSYPIREIPLPMDKVLMASMSTKGIESKLDELTQTVKGIKQTNIDFDGLNNLVVTSKENGKVSVVHYYPKSTLRG